MLDEFRKTASERRTQKRRERIARPAREPDAVSRQVQSKTTKRDILIVDLNNFATFPTLAVGLLVAALRNGGHRVQVMCPLAYDVPAGVREYPETRKDHLKRRLHLSTAPWLRRIRDFARQVHRWRTEQTHPRTLKEVTRALDAQPDILLLSAYLQHYKTIREVAKLAKAKGVPVLLGGPMFNVPETAAAWQNLDGVTAIAGAEVDLNICEIVEGVLTKADLSVFPGITVPGAPPAQAARPLRPLDAIPIPDYTDFPWDRYPAKIIPVMTGRGCQWDKCLFCSDVISASGRTFRTKSIETVLLELQELSRRHDSANFVFLDLKLNSYPDMIRSIGAQIQNYVRGAQWIGTVHVDQRKDNGLSRDDLFAAVSGGMRRISFGLESGSQQLLDRMQKGSSVERNSEFIRNAHDAGLSVRATMFKGFPGETAADLDATADFLEAHIRFLDRVRFNEFSLMEGTPIFEAVMRKDPAAADIAFLNRDTQYARGRYRSADKGRAYRQALKRVLEAVFEINQRPIRNSARHFDGLM